VGVAAFDPTTARYITHVTSSIPIQVVDAPRFDPATLDYVAPATGVSPTLFRANRVRTVSGVTLAIAGLALSVVIASAWARRWKPDPGRWLVRRARRLDSAWDAVRAAREIREDMAAYLERATGRPRGVLTPDEACAAVAAATEDAELGSRAGRLVAQCDRASYSDQETDSERLIAEGRSLFLEIGGKRRRESGEREEGAWGRTGPGTKAKERQP
jgi:hypothetical protein